MIGIYAADVPPVRGGVADHTLTLARALAAAGAPPVVLARRGDAGRFAPLACATGIRPRDLGAAARAHGVSALLLQYVPFLYARFGVAPGLVRAATRLREGGITFAVFVHEPYVPFTRLPWLVTGWPQRWQLAALVHRAAFSYAAVPDFAVRIRRHISRGAVVRLVPVGATLPVSTLSRAAARAALGLADGDVAIGVFSPGASGFLDAWIAAAAARLAGHPRVRWVLFGHGSERAWPHWPRGPRDLVLGELDAAGAARAMRALDVAAAPYADGLTLRRTGAMFALAHGIATVSATGPLFDPSLTELADSADTPAAFAQRLEQLANDPAGRHALAARTAAYGARASVDVAARIIARDLLGGA